MTDLEKARGELLEIVSQVSQGSWTIVLLAAVERVLEAARREGAKEALPAKPSAELIEAVEDAIRESMSIDIDERVQAPVAYFAVRAAILGEDA